MRLIGSAAVSVILGFSIAASVTCSKKPDSWKGRIIIEDGIKVAHNTKDPLSSPAAITFTSELTIGQESDRQDAVIFRNLMPYGCVDTDASGSIYILDSGADTVFKLDPQGRLQKSFGRQGQGPGEFQSPGCIKVMPGGEIAVVDDIARKLVQFSQDGTFLKEERLASFPESGMVSLDSQGGIVTVSITESGDRLAMSLIRILPGQKRIVKYAEAETRRVYDGTTLDLYIPQFRLAVSGGDAIVWGFQREYVLNVSDLSGKVLRRIKKDYDPTPITETAFQTRLKEAFGGRAVPQNITPVHPPSYWPFSLLIADEKGRILARIPNEPADGKMKYDVFDEEGRFAASVELNGFPVLWKDGRLFVLEESPEAGQFLRCMRVRWN